MNKLHTALVALFLSAAMQAGAATAVFAGGCFWCMEAAYQEVPGVSDVVSGFTGGSHPNPTYNGAHTGHYEAVEVTYDPGQISFEQLLVLFWANVDPFDGDGQFCDRGESYRPAIFVAGDGERA
ncbi:MAG: peptide-methionine (S)-S-oxide reductase MsrA, partial [Halieaceae bacterium]|nr:peptide-methionine (S)-S-oxide reductase MsrA [Halieaceae bacterium]